VQNLLELAATNAPAEAKISAKEIDAKIAKLIRSPDSAVSLKAMEMHQKRETAQASVVVEEELSPKTTRAESWAVSSAVSLALRRCSWGSLRSTARASTSRRCRYSSNSHQTLKLNFQKSGPAFSTRSTPSVGQRPNSLRRRRWWILRP